MFLGLAIASGIFGLAVTGAAVYTAWIVYEQQHKEAGNESGNRLPGSFLPRFMALDFALLALFAIGMLFLLTDVVAVMRDRANFPDYHFGYLLCGFVFSLVGVLFLLLRLFLLIRSIDGRLSVPGQHHKPDEADQAE